MQAQPAIEQAIAKYQIKLKGIATWEESQKIVSALDDELQRGVLLFSHYLWMILAIVTGARTSELLSLTPSSFDFNKKVCYIQQLKKGRRVRLCECGTRNPRRAVYCHKCGVTISSLALTNVGASKVVVREALLFESMISSLKSYVAKKKPNEPVFDFRRRNGLYITYSVTKRILGRRVRTHGFRHTATLRVAKLSKGNMEVIRRFGGWTNYNSVKPYLESSLEDQRDELSGLDPKKDQPQNAT